jgi:hypothetical protein
LRRLQEARATAIRKFVVRYPYAMDNCRRMTPLLVRTDERRAATCFLYKESPRLEGTDLLQVMVKPVPVGA